MFNMNFEKVRNLNGNTDLHLSPKKNRKHVDLDDTENVLSTQTTELIDMQRKNHKKLSKFAPKVELLQESNTTDEKGNDIRYQSSVNKNNKNNNTIDSLSAYEIDTSAIRKKKKRRRDRDSDCDVKETGTEPNSYNVLLNSSKNENIDNRLEVPNDKKSDKSVECNPTKKKKRKKNRHSECDTKDSEIEQNDSNDQLACSKNENTEKVLEVRNVRLDEFSVPKKKKRKRNQDSESDSKTQSEIDHDSSSNNQEVSPNNETLASDALAILNAKSDQSSVLRQKKKKRKKNQNQTTAANLLLQLSEPAENSDENATSKALKSSLKKKKHKNKKKSIDQTKLKGDGGDGKMNQKNSSKKSVTFDETVKVELIESCQETVDEKVQQNNSRKKEKAIAYLRKWKDDKDNWKFEKLTQLWLLKNMYQESMVPAETFTTLLDYLVDLKGASRDLVVDLSEKIIAKMEQKPSEENDPELETAHNRARSVLQFIQ